jgi:DNA-binding winged helix-turn-helix (wHTH) protein
MPFSPEELLARAIVISRRATGIEPPLIPVIKLGEIEIDILNRVVRVGVSEIHLSGIEQSLLYLLASRAGSVVTKEEILDAIWGTDFVAESNIVDRHIRSLRIKLQDDWRQPRFIATVHGQGYRFAHAHLSVVPALSRSRGGADPKDRRPWRRGARSPGPRHPLGVGRSPAASAARYAWIVVAAQ